MNGELKFILITDLHYYDPALGISGKAYDELSGTDMKCLAESGAIIDAYFDKIAKDKDFDIVLIAGDLSCNGAKESHTGLLPKLRRLKEAGKRVFLITATHDYYLEGNGTGCAERCDGDRLSHATRTGREELVDLYREFGLDEAISFHPESHSYCVSLCGGYRLLCLNDDGDKIFCGYSESQLEWIDSMIKEAHKAGDYIFAMTHHPVLPPSPIYPLFSRRDMLGDYEKTACFLADRGVKFIFTGHTHMQNIARYTTPAGNDFYDINTACLVGYPSVMRRVVMTGSEVKITSDTVTGIDWDLKGMTFEEYTKSQFSHLLNDIFDSLANDYDRFANVLAPGFSKTPEEMYKMKFLLYPFGKLLNSITLGGLGRLLFVSGSVDKSIRKVKLKDFILSIIQNIYYGDEPYTPDTAEYKAFCAAAGRAKGLLKLKKGTEDIAKIIDVIRDGVLYDAAPPDWNAVLPK